MVPPVNYKCPKCKQWCGSRMYVPIDDDVIFRCCNKTFSVKGKHFEDLFKEALALVDDNSEYIGEF
jgi:hypothetical protein